MSAYIFSKQTYSITELDITYAVSAVPQGHIVTIATGKTIKEVVEYVNADFITNSIPLEMKLDKERLYFENSNGEEIMNVTWTGTADDLIAIGGIYTYSTPYATASVFGARLPFIFTLESPNDYSNINDQVGGIYEKEIYQKTLAGETYNGVNGSSSSRFLRRKGWLFNIRINQVLLDDFDWFIESCRDAGANIYGASDFNISDTIVYVIQPKESESMTPVYKHLDIYEINLAYLEE